MGGIRQHVYEFRCKRGLRVRHHAFTLLLLVPMFSGPDVEFPFSRATRIWSLIAIGIAANVASWVQLGNGMLVAVDTDRVGVRRFGRLRYVPLTEIDLDRLANDDTAYRVTSSWRWGSHKWLLLHRRTSPEPIRVNCQLLEDGCEAIRNAILAVAMR